MSSGRPAVAAGPSGCAAVATGNAASTAAAVAVLNAGGNAVDGAVAAGFASAVAEPGLTSIAGGGFLNVHFPDGSASVLDFFTTVPGIERRGPAPEPATITVVYPSAQQDFRVGPASAAVPGVLSGYLEAHRRYGRLPISEVVAPAVRLADVGAVIDSSQAYILTLIEPIARHTPSAAAVYAPGGELLVAGDILRDRELHSFLQAVADGAITGLTSPGIAEPLLAMAADGSGITAADLALYQPIWRDPLHDQLHGWTVLTNPAPAFGGQIITTALRLLDDYGFAALAVALGAATAAVKNGPAATTGTTHISIVDSEGLVAAMTTTNGAGGGVLIPGTGIQLNNMLGEDDLIPDGIEAMVPGARLASMSAPTVVLAPDGTLTALGSGGSARIRSALAGVIVRLRDGHESLADAIAGPRVHLEESGVVQAEAGLSVEALAQLREVFEVNIWDRTDFYFGGVNAVQRNPDGSVLAVADHRRNGSAAVVPPAGQTLR